MKRTEKKLKSKGIKTHKPNRAHAYWCYKYDRNYVAKCEEEMQVIPRVAMKKSQRLYVVMHLRSVL